MKSQDLQQNPPPLKGTDLRYPLIASMLASVFLAHFAAAQTSNGALQQPAEDAPSGVEIPAAGLIAREITLRQIGFASGIEFQRLAGEAELFFPAISVMPWKSAVLTLDLTHEATVQSDRYLQVSFDGRIVKSFALDQQGGRLSVEIPVPRDAVSGGFLRVGLVYSGAVAERTCVDQRLSGDYVSISSGSGLTLGLDPAELNTPEVAAGYLPGRVNVALPAGALTPVATAAAIRAAALFGGETGMVQFSNTDIAGNADIADGRILIEPSEFGIASQMSAAASEAGVQMRISGTDPQQGLYQLKSKWASLADTETVLTQTVATAAPVGETISFRDLNANLAAQAVSGSSTFEFSFESANLPKAMTIDAVDVLVAAAPDPDGNGTTVTAFLNNTFIGSRPLDALEPVWINFAVPEGLIGRNNTMRILVQRQPRGGSCVYDIQGYPAQIFPESRFRLASVAAPVSDFFALRQAAQDGVSVVVSNDIAIPAGDVLGWVSGVAGTLIPDGANIYMVDSANALDGRFPFIVVSDTAPEGSDPTVRPENGAIEIADSTGVTLFKGEDLDRVGIVQIVKIGEQFGIWLKPGAGPSPKPTPENPLVLDRGDLALLDADGVAISVSTSRADLIQIVYPDQTNIRQILEKYRPWFFGGLWIMATIILLGVFQRAYRARRKTGE